MIYPNAHVDYMKKYSAITAQEYADQQATSKKYPKEVFHSITVDNGSEF